jgi:hypothetical protein
VGFTSAFSELGGRLRDLPIPGGAACVAACVPAFAPGTVRRDDDG